MLPPPFDHLPATAASTKKLDAGERLFLQGDKTTSIYFLASGDIRLVRYGEAGHLVPVFRAAAGDTFAEAALFSPTYHCNAVAQTPSTVIALNKTEILQAMAQDPLFGLALAQRFAGQVQRYRRKLEILAIPKAEDRVFAALSDGWLTGKVVDFASEIGLSHEATFRALAQLVRKGRAVKVARGLYRVAAW
ncbi:Crp/Fnr family transcriptional regulator [Alisedimentitalea sp. MJ-SS2]|nr:Crp/Fnr family transcriptional regulator [Alisedimentitalea sp. MJ-SS2]